MLEFTETDIVESEKFCSEIAVTANELAIHPSGFFRRFPLNVNLTRAIAYNLTLQKASHRPVTVNPLRFALDMLFIHRGLYGGPTAALEGDNRNFYEAFFDLSHHCWPVSCGWEHTWHVIGSEEMYPDIRFEPTREYCLMEDSKFFGTRAQTNRVETISTSIVTVHKKSGETKCESAGESFTRKETLEYISRLPSGHNATIRLEIKTSESSADYQVDLITDEGYEGIGSKQWKAAREISSGEVLAVILNRTEKVISEVWAEPTEKSPIDAWFRLAKDSREVAVQLTTIEPAYLYSGLASGKRLEHCFSRSNLLEFVNNAFDRKRTQSASGIHLVLDCGFLIPGSDEFASDVQTILLESPLSYESVWLISRVNGYAICLCGESPF